MYLITSLLLYALVITTLYQHNFATEITTEISQYRIKDDISIGISSTLKFRMTDPLECDIGGQRLWR